MWFGSREPQVVSIDMDTEENPCTRSDNPPATASSQCQVDGGSHHQDLHSQSPSSPRIWDRWMTFISRIPQEISLSQILTKIIADPNNKAAWYELLHFSPLILANQSKVG